MDNISEFSVDDHVGDRSTDQSFETARIKYDEWMGRKKFPITGEIISVGKDSLSVLVDEREMAVMYRTEWVPKEYGLYQPYQTMRFMIHSLKCVPEFTIRLSRSSIQLPAKLLEDRFPEYRFVCQKRYIGQKSVIKTDAKITKLLIQACKNIAKELSGEFLELRPF
jgi:hypothetical protein